MWKRLGIFIFVGTTLILATVGIIFRSHSHGSLPIRKVSLSHSGTNDNFQSIVAEGRIVACPDAEVVLRTEYAGIIQNYPAKEHENVQKGALLASLRADDVEARLAKAQASLDLANASFSFAEKQFHRDEKLRRTRAISLSSFEREKKNFEMAKAQKERAEASLGLYQAILLKTRILAPIQGVIIARFHNQGEYVQVGSRIVTIADLDRTRVDAEVDEFDAGRVRLSDSVTIKAEGYSNLWKGVVVSISEKVSRKHLIPDDPSRPTDTGVVHVKIAPIGRLPFKLGQKVDVNIDGDIKGKVPVTQLTGIKHCSGE